MTKLARWTWLVGLLLVGGTAVAADLTGTWTVYFDGDPVPSEWIFTQTGTNVTVTFPGGIAGGTIDPLTGEFVIAAELPLPCPSFLVGHLRADDGAFWAEYGEGQLVCGPHPSTCECRIGPPQGAANGCRAGAGACCGDAVVDAGETCDDGPQLGSCCDGTCSYATGQVCTSDADICTADVCDAAGACVHPAEPDSDGDGTCDPIDPCPDGAPLARPRVKLGRFTTPPGDDRLDVKTELALPASPPLDPVGDGVILQVTNTDGSPAFDATLPPGAWSPATATGWKRNAAGTTFTFRSPTARARIAAVKSRPGHVAVSLKLVEQAIATPAPPLGVRLLLGPPGSTQGRCGETSFAACVVGRGGATVVCR